jgi:hypothetical protein
MRPCHRAWRGLPWWASALTCARRAPRALPSIRTRPRFTRFHRAIKRRDREAGRSSRQIFHALAADLTPALRARPVTDRNWLRRPGRGVRVSAADHYQGRDRRVDPSAGCCAERWICGSRPSRAGGRRGKAGGGLNMATSMLVGDQGASQIGATGASAQPRDAPKHRSRIITIATCSKCGRTTLSGCASPSIRALRKDEDLR